MAKTLALILLAWSSLLSCLQQQGPPVSPFLLPAGPPVFCPTEEEVLYNKGQDQIPVTQTSSTNQNHSPCPECTLTEEQDFQFTWQDVLQDQWALSIMSKGYAKEFTSPLIYLLASSNFPIPRNLLSKKKHSGRFLSNIDTWGSTPDTLWSKTKGNLS